MKRLRAVIGVVAGLWLLGLLMAVLYFGWFPDSRSGWLWLVILGPPVAFAVEGLGELYNKWWQGTPLARHVSEKTEGRRFSWLRILVALLFTCVGMGAVLGVLWLVDGS